MNASDDKGPAGETPALGDLMLTMDVADTLRHAEDSASDAEALAQLQQLYASLGLGVSGEVLADGLAAYRANRFAYRRPQTGLRATLARLYVGRHVWLRPAWTVVLMLAIGFGGYFLVYRPYRDAQTQQAEVELAQTLPAQMDALYSTIFDETKVQQAANDAAELRDEGKQAAAKGDRAGADAALGALTALRDTLRQDYRLTIVNRPNAKWGFWTFPEDNDEATNYYLVVEARTSEGATLTLPIRNEQTGKTDNVSMWGIRVPEAVYRSVEADVADDGIIQRAVIGLKQFGFVEPDYLIDTLGGAVTRW